MYWSCLHRRRRPFLLPTPFLSLDPVWTKRSHPTIWIRSPPGGASIHRGELPPPPHYPAAFMIYNKEKEAKSAGEGDRCLRDPAKLRLRDSILIRVHESRDPTRRTGHTAYASNENRSLKWKVIQKEKKKKGESKVSLLAMAIRERFVSRKFLSFHVEMRLYVLSYARN